MDDLLTFLGLIFILEGLPYLAFPQQVKRWAGLLLEVDEGVMRLIGLLSMAGGLVLVYIGRRLLAEGG